MHNFHGFFFFRIILSIPFIFLSRQFISTREKWAYENDIRRSDSCSALAQARVRECYDTFYSIFGLLFVPNKSEFNPNAHDLQQ